MRNLTTEEKEAIAAAHNENHVESKEILSELLPLLNDYFLAEINECKEGISLNLYNGQNFILSVSENL